MKATIDIANSAARSVTAPVTGLLSFGAKPSEKEPAVVPPSKSVDAVAEDKKEVVEEVKWVQLENHASPMLDMFALFLAAAVPVALAYYAYYAFALGEEALSMEVVKEQAKLFGVLPNPFVKGR